ncbi:hypothetical protein M3Y99_01625400 [Aphelenchoides fujianensis]|nr:hypothetical protein M3Y99_01625400 [Aphelenchoides fujianensis]
MEEAEIKVDNRRLPPGHSARRLERRKFTNLVWICGGLLLFVLAIPLVFLFVRWLQTPESTGGKPLGSECEFRFEFENDDRRAIHCCIPPEFGTERAEVKREKLGPIVRLPAGIPEANRPAGAAVLQRAVDRELAELLRDPPFELLSAFNQTFGLVRRLKALHRFEKEGDLEAKRQAFIENFSSTYRGRLLTEMRAMNESGDASKAADPKWQLAKLATLLRADGIHWPFDVTPVRPPNSTRLLPLLGQRLRVEWPQGGSEEWRARYENATHFRAFVRKAFPGLDFRTLNELPPVPDWPTFFDGTSFGLEPNSRVYFKSLHFFEELQRLQGKGGDLVESTIHLTLAEQLNEFSFLFEKDHEGEKDFAAFVCRLLPLFSSVLIDSQLPADAEETKSEVVGILDELSAEVTAGLSNLFPPNYELFKRVAPFIPRTSKNISVAFSPARSNEWALREVERISANVLGQIREETLDPDFFELVRLIRRHSLNDELVPFNTTSGVNEAEVDVEYVVDDSEEGVVGRLLISRVLLTRDAPHLYLADSDEIYLIRRASLR